MENKLIEELLKKIEINNQLLEAQVKSQDLCAPGRLWCIDDLCYFFGVSASKLHRMRKEPGFPRPSEMHYNSGARQSKFDRWLPEDVRNYSKRLQRLN